MSSNGSRPGIYRVAGVDETGSPSTWTEHTAFAPTWRASQHGAPAIASRPNQWWRPEVRRRFIGERRVGVDAVLVTARCSDPFDRRSVLVTMGMVFPVPWTRIESWPAGIADLQAAGFAVASLVLLDDLVTLAE